VVLGSPLPPRNQLLGDLRLPLQPRQSRLLIHPGHLLAGGQPLAHDGDDLAVGGRLLLQGPRRQLVQTGPHGDGGRWALPLFSLALGGVVWAASWIGGRPMAGPGLACFGIMAWFGAVFVVGRRSESLRMMAAGRGADERWRTIDQRAPPPSPDWP
jgi:hypothetical protein